MQKVITIFRNHKKKIVGFIIAVLLIMGASQVLGSRDNKPVIVVTGKVIKDKFEQSVFATGTIEVKDQKEIFAKVSSPIVEIAVEAGQKVKAGQVILKQEADDLVLRAAEAQAAFDARQSELISLQSNLKTGQNELMLVTKDYERKKALYEMGAVSLQELELAEKSILQEEEEVRLLNEAKIPLLKAQIAEAQIALERTKDALNKAVVTSPIEGTILSLPVKENHPVQMGTLLASVGNLLEMQIETGINEVDAADLQIGNEVEITSEGVLAEPSRGVIEYIAPIAQLERTSQGDQTQVKIRVSVEAKEDFKLKPGYSVSMKIILVEKDKAVLVPYEAVTQRDGKDIVFSIDNEGKAIAKEIQLGLSSALFFEVISGVSAGEKLVLNPTEEINDGVRVKVNDKN